MWPPWEQKKTTPITNMHIGQVNYAVIHSSKTPTDCLAPYFAIIPSSFESITFVNMCAVFLVHVTFVSVLKHGPALLSHICTHDQAFTGTMDYSWLLATNDHAHPQRNNLGTSKDVSGQSLSLPRLEIGGTVCFTSSNTVVPSPTSIILATNKITVRWIRHYFSLLQASLQQWFLFFSFRWKHVHKLLAFEYKSKYKSHQ